MFPFSKPSTWKLTKFLAGLGKTLISFVLIAIEEEVPTKNASVLLSLLVSFGSSGTNSFTGSSLIPNTHTATTLPSQVDVFTENGLSKAPSIIEEGTVIPVSHAIGNSTPSTWLRVPSDKAKSSCVAWSITRTPINHNELFAGIVAPLFLIVNAIGWLATGPTVDIEAGVTKLTSRSY